MPNRLFGFLFPTWLVLLTVLSLMPADDLDLDGPDIPYLDKWAHFGFYGVAAVLGALYLWERKRPDPVPGKSLLFLGIALAVYGMIIEVLQGIGGQDRSAEWLDLGANILGIVSGAWISRLLLRKAGH